MNRKQNLTKKAQEKLIKELQTEVLFLKQKLQMVRITMLGIIDSPFPLDTNKANEALKNLDNEEVQKGIAKEQV